MDWNEKSWWRNKSVLEWDHSDDRGAWKNRKSVGDGAIRDEETRLWLAWYIDEDSTCQAGCTTNSNLSSDFWYP